MRKLLLSLLLASAVATPALARPGDDDSDRQSARAERQAARAERQQSRAERQAPAERPRLDVQRQFNGSNGGQQAVVQQRMQMDDAQRQAFRADRQRLRSADGGQDAANWQQRRQQVLQNRAQAEESLRQSDRPVPGVFRPRTRTPVVSDVPRPGTQPRLRDGNGRHDRTRWSTGWRNDNRYDWYNWRSRHRSLFRIGFYSDPFGWGYQPYSIGWRLWPNYYSSNYWINDPWQYRLPYAPAGYRWVRYYNDAILVDTWSGEVVDVIRNFFW